MRVVAIVLSLQLVAALQVKSRSSMLQAVKSQMENTGDSEANDTPKCDKCNYGYVTMFIDKEKMAAARPDMFVHRTSEEKIKVSSGEAHGILVDTKEPELSAVEDNKKANIPGFTNYLNDKAAVLELARNLKSVGAMYPLVVLTNDPAFKGRLDSVSQSKDSLGQYGVIETVLISDYLIPQCTMREATIAHYQKFAAFDLTKFDKLLYLEPNIRVRNAELDSLFGDTSLDTDKTSFFMRDSWSCDPDVDKISMSAMLFKPRHEVFQSVMDLNMDGMEGYMQDCPSTEAIMKCTFAPKTCLFKGSEKWMIDVPAREQVYPMEMDYLPPSTINYQHCTSIDDSDESGASDMIQYGATVKTVLNPVSFIEQPKEDM